MFRKIIPVFVAGSVLMGALTGCSQNAEPAEETVTDEKLAQLAPVSEEKVQALNEMEGHAPEETWAVYLYMCGSDLESGGISQISEITSFLAEDEAENYSENYTERVKEQVLGFVEELKEKNITLPESIYRQGQQLPLEMEYEPEESSGESAAEEETAQAEEEDFSFPGAGTEDLEELMTVQLPENVTFVIQTGGAGRWKRPGINPNKSQIFTYSADGFKKVLDEPAKNMGNPKTLEDFLTFCRDNYPADHKMALFWDHGSGCFGFGSDEIFAGDSLTLDEMRQAFSQVYSLSEEEPPFELVGFDACLMASMEVGNAFSDIAKYMVASEEVEPGTGWDYHEWVSELAEHPEKNGAQIGKAICDSFIRTSVTAGTIENGYTSEVLTGSVMDLSKIGDVYTAYETLAREAFLESNENVRVLSLLGRAANRSVKYAQSLYKIYNTIDLGAFMANIRDELPELDTSSVSAAIDSCVLYTRGTAYAQNSEGISVYFPTSMDQASSLTNMLEYISGISKSDAVNCLYYYKVAGCLNEYYTEYAQRELGIGTVNVWNASVADGITDLPVDTNENQLSLTLKDEMIPYISDVALRISRLDEENMQVYNYGEDYLAHADAGNIYGADLSGKWISIDGNPLYTDIIDSTEQVIRYSAPVRYNGAKVYLIFAYDYAKERFEMLGIQQPSESASVVGRNLQILEEGAELIPIYPGRGLRDTDTELQGTPFKYRKNSELKDTELENGYYLAFLEFSDFRDEKHYSGIAGFEMKDGQIERVESRSDLAYMLY